MMNLQKLMSMKWGTINLLFIYIFWSSTFLAIRIIVSNSYSIPPFIMNSGRMMIGGLLLLFLGQIFNLSLLPSLTDIYICLISAICIWGGGTALLTWSLQYLNSGIAAVITALIPIVVVLINILLGKQKISLFLILALLCGFIGLLIIVLPNLNINDITGNAALFAVMASTILCSLGFVLQSTVKPSLSNIVLSAYQLIIASFIFISISIYFNETFSINFIPVEVMLSWLYLTVVTAIGVFAFLNVVKLLPLDICMTYAYVNPVLALLWGIVFLDEKLSIFIIVGTIMIILSVIGVFKENINNKIK